MRCRDQYGTIIPVTIPFGIHGGAECWMCYGCENNSPLTGASAALIGKSFQCARIHWDGGLNNPGIKYYEEKQDATWGRIYCSIWARVYQRDANCRVILESGVCVGGLNVTRYGCPGIWPASARWTDWMSGPSSPGALFDALYNHLTQSEGWSCAEEAAQYSQPGRYQLSATNADPGFPHGWLVADVG